MSDFLTPAKMSWAALIFSGLLECVRATTMALSRGFSVLSWTIVTGVVIFFSMWSLSYALKTIPVSIGYAIFVAIGAIGALLAGRLFFAEELTMFKIFGTILIVSGIVLLKIEIVRP